MSPIAIPAMLNRIVLTGALAMAVASVGCTTRTQSFPGYADNQLWPAMVASAETPTYRDWRVLGNDVYADDGARTIEVYRLLRRSFYSPDAPAREEDREWRFRISIGHDPELLAPTISFTSRQIAVPAYVWEEADRYFLQVRALLANPTPSGEESATDGGTAPESTAGTNAPNG